MNRLQPGTGRRKKTRRRGISREERKKGGGGSFTRKLANKDLGEKKKGKPEMKEGKSRL